MDLYMTEDVETLKNLDFMKPEESFNGFILIPTGETHDSGYGCMKFILLNYDKVVGCVGGGSDIVALNGIGGYGGFHEDHYQEVLRTRKIPVVDWSIDLLPNGLFRVFCSHNLKIEGMVLSTFQVVDAGEED